MSGASELILPGLKPVLELLATQPQRIARIYLKNTLAGKNIQHLLNLCQKHHIQPEMVPESRLAAICASSQQNHISHQGVVAILEETSHYSVAQILTLAPDAPLPLVIALDQVQDPGNAGAICRTAWAMGCAGLFIPKHNTASLGAAAARASAGALALLPYCEVTNLARALDEAEENGFSIYGAGCQGPDNTNAFGHVWSLPAVLVLGNEKNGLRPGVAKRCQSMLKIPLLRQFDSLNVAQAGGILIALCAAQQLKQLS